MDANGAVVAISRAVSASARRSRPDAVAARMRSHRDRLLERSQDLRGDPRRQLLDRRLLVGPLGRERTSLCLSAGATATKVHGEAPVTPA
jgi:hypothetical protein